jgi:acetyl esterase/lipase
MRGSLSKKKHIVNSFFFYLGLIIVFGLFLLLISFVNGYWYAYLVPVLCGGLLIALRRSVFWQKAWAFLCYALAIAISFTSLYFFRPVDNVSCGGTITREAIDFIIDLPIRDSNNNILTRGYTRNNSLWITPKDYKLTRTKLDGYLPVELLQRKDKSGDKVILHLHGGAYVIGYIDAYRQVALRYSRQSGGADVLSVDYRTAPEYTFPAALEDALKAWDWLLQKGYKEENIIIAGDSAGGNLALALTLKLRDADRPLPKALVLMSPWADMANQGPSHTHNQNKDPIFGNSKGIVNNVDGKSNPYAADNDVFNPYLSPVYAEYHDFPDMLIQVGTYEILESDSETIYQKALAKGVNVTLSKYEGMFHDFQLAGMLLPESRQAWKEVKEFIHSQFYE